MLPALGGFGCNLGLVGLGLLSRGGLYERDELVEQFS